MRWAALAVAVIVVLTVVTEFFFGSLGR
jgi:hypothetical protein